MNTQTLVKPLLIILLTGFPAVDAVERSIQGATEGGERVAPKLAIPARWSTTRSTYASMPNERIEHQNMTTRTLSLIWRSCWPVAFSQSAKTDTSFVSGGLSASVGDGRARTAVGASRLLAPTANRFVASAGG
jgi:hypothetical protein